MQFQFRPPVTPAMPLRAAPLPRTVPLPKLTLPSIAPLCIAPARPAAAIGRAPARAVVVRLPKPAERAPRAGQVWLTGGVLLAASGCASIGSKPAATRWTVEPVYSVTVGASSAGYYALGRYHEGSQAWGKAIDAYRQAIVADEHNVDARNALGVALAHTGRLDEAEAVLRQAVALDAANALARNNLGYLLLLTGRPAEARNEFEAALRLDASNAVAAANLREAVARLPAAPAAAVAAAATAATPTIATTVATPTRTTAETAATTTTAATPTTKATPTTTTNAATATTVATAGASAAAVTPRLEISNGNGVRGMAARLGHFLSVQGIPTSRLTNERPFARVSTVVEYRSGFAAAAERVARALPQPATMQETPMRAGRSDIRVVLGRDLARTAAWPAPKALAASDAARQAYAPATSFAPAAAHAPARVAVTLRPAGLQ